MAPVIPASHAERLSPPSPGLLAWYREGTPAARRSLWAASLGWMLDAFDVMLYSLVLSSLMGDFSITKATAGFLGAVTLIASGAGGVLFGFLADRYGRRRAMMASILVYSVFTAACGLTQTVWQLGACRFLLGLGMGGEWTTGAALVAETWPDRHRGKAMGFMHSFFAVGYTAAALMVAVVLPAFGWRMVFFVGVVPALLVFWVRRNVEESELWVSSRATRTRADARLRDIFQGHLARPTILLTLLSMFTLFSYWGLNFWVPAYLSLPVAQGGLGFNTSLTTQLVVTMQVGTWLGLVSFGYVCDALGRRKSYVMYLLIGAALVILYGRTHNPLVLLFLGPFVAFFGTGHLSGFGTISAEIFPTSVRATAQGFTFNVGRIGSAFAPFLAGSVAQARGFEAAFVLTAFGLLLGTLTWLGLPETRGRSLS